MRDERATEKSERRENTRFSAGLHADVCLPGGAVRCEASNLSRTGVLAIGPFPDMRAEQVAITLFAPIGDLQLKLRGRVARFDEDEGPERKRLALEFLDVDDAKASTIEVLIKRVLAAHRLVQLDDIPQNASPAKIRATLQRIPVAHRVAIAHRANIRQRAVLKHDANPQVLEALARNPNLLEGEVRVLAGLRGLLPSTIELMAHDPRWQADEDLKVLLAMHPRVPVPLAEKLLGSVKPIALQRALQRPGLNDSVRSTLLRKLSRRV
jgi:hypothetical protein